MKKIYWQVIVLAAVLSFIMVYAVREAQVAPRAITYQDVLGKSLSDRVAVDFLAGNHCSGVGPYQVCKESGMAFWTDSNKIIKAVYLYSGHADGFKSYKGELPFGLKFYDTLGAVEYKLQRQGVGNAGLPDEGSTPDHFHYWAVYRRAGVTVIYNFPYPDEDATIYAILVSSSQMPGSGE